MRPLIVAAIVASISPSAPLADDAIPVDLAVGESKEIGGFRPLCDDPSVASFAADGSGKLEGRRPGETTCSVSRGSPLGPRQIYRIVVRPKASRDQGRDAGHR